MELTDPPVGDPVPVITHVERLSAMEYRYDGGRQRYMTRSRSASDMLPDDAATLWHDYAGQSIHSDYRVSHEVGQSPVVTEAGAHVPGVMGYDRTAAPGDRHRYLLGNLIGTTEGECEPDGTVTGRTVYTAFGEVVGTFGAPAGRYGYAGAWGYQAPSGQFCGPPGEEFYCDPLAELGWLHVGERYYDPSSGRFVQRDPIGIAGGANVYVYADNSPAVAIDPDGFIPHVLGPEGPIFGHGRGLNVGEVRVGWSRTKTGYRKWSSKFALRVGPKHVYYGIRAVRACSGLIMLAAEGGYLAGTALDHGVGFATGARLSDYIGNWMWQVWAKEGKVQGYEPW